MSFLLRVLPSSCSLGCVLGQRVKVRSALGALSCALTAGHFEIVLVEVLHSLCRASFLIALIIL